MNQLISKLEKAEYFIMRLDEGGKDIEHIKACRIGVHSYANAIENHLPELAKDLRERYPLLDTPPVSANNAELMDIDKPDGVYAVNLSWGINYHPTDLSKVMKAKDCLFIGTGKECADFIYKNKPAPVSAREDVLPTQEQIDAAIDKYAFRVPYNGSNSFYDEAALKHFKAGIEWFKSALTTPTK